MSAIGYDLGNHSSYVAVVKAGGIDTVDNEYSYRATPTYISFTDRMRFTGNSAKSQSVTNYKNTFFSFKNLVGLKLTDVHAKNEQNYLPLSFINYNENLGIECNYLNKSHNFTITQLVAMILSDLKRTTLAHVPKIISCGINCPNFFTFIQRQAILNACTIVGLNPALISDTAAVCLNYCLFKTDLPKENEAPRIVCFVDVGYSCTQICIAAFNAAKIKVLSSIGTNEIGGRNFDFLLFDKFSSEFQQKHKLDVKTNKRAFFKLLNECETLKKQVNSTTTELPLKIECFMNEIDFLSKTSRDELDILSGHIYEQFNEILQKSISHAQVDISQIHSIEAVGGSSRLLGLRKLINNVFKKEVSTTLNADEAVVRGCSIQAALLNPIIKMREIEMKDALTLNYTVIYMNKNSEIKELKVYNPGDLIPSRKELIFPPSKDFNFTVTQTDITGQVHEILKVTSYGNNPEEINAEKLVFWCNVDLSHRFSVTKSFYMIKNDETEEKSKISKLTQDVKFDTEILGYIDIAQCKLIEEEMLKQIEYEKLRSSNKNALEEFIYNSRDICEGAYRGYITDEEYGTFMSGLKSNEDWLYEDGDFETAEVYQNRLSELQNQFLPFKSRFEAFTNGSSSLERLFQVLSHYRKFIDVYQNDPKKYEHLSASEVSEYVQRIKQIDAFAFETDSILKNTPKFKLPSVSVAVIEQKISELKAYCDKLLKKAENPPPPPKPEPEKEKVEENNGPNIETVENTVQMECEEQNN